MKKYKDWKLDKIRRVGQWYANFIIRHLKTARNNDEFIFWLGKGYYHDAYMIGQHDIFLD